MRSVRARSLVAFASLISLASLISVDAVAQAPSAAGSDFQDNASEGSYSDALIGGATAQDIQHEHGSWQVTSHGSLAYELPLQLPTGRLGMQPHLALTYDSNASNGLVGVGWSLTGLPAITRVNAGSGIRYQGSDTYAVNYNGWGTPVSPEQRLVASSASPGAFHTQLDDLKLYRPNGTCGDGPCYFTAQDGKGNTYYFGSTSSTDGTSNLWEHATTAVPKSRGILVWGLSRVEDPNGNYWDVAYSQFDDGFYPATIGYTLSNKGTTPSHWLISFEYERRGDTVSAPIHWTQRLHSVTINVAYPIVVYQRYLFTYEDSPATGRSRLTQVQKIGSDLNWTNAPPPIKFKYTQATNGWQAPVEVSNDALPKLPQIDHAGERRWQTSAGDINGDGFADVVRVSQSQSGRKIYVQLGSYSGLSAPSTYLNDDGPIDKHWTSFLADLNCDGKKDLVMVYAGHLGLYIHYALGTATGLGPIQYYTARSPYNASDYSPLSDEQFDEGWRVVPADMTGDRCMDIAFVQTQKYIVQIAWSGPQGLTQTVDYSASFPAHDPTAQTRRVFATDINGDGISDLVIGQIDFSGPGFLYMLGNGLGQPTWGPTIGSYVALSAWEVWYGDFVATDLNGDRNADIAWVYMGPGGRYVRAFFGDGSGNFSPRFDLVNDAHDYPGAWPYAPEHEAQAAFHAGDFNGDGLGDLVAEYRGKGGFWRAIASGSWTDSLVFNEDGQNTNTPLADGDQFAPKWHSTAGDINGDGRTDIVVTYQGPLGTYIGYSLGGNSGLGPMQWSHTDTHSTGGGDDASEVALLADVNGDGKDDVLLMSERGDAPAVEGIRQALTASTPDDLVVEIDNGIGGVVTVGHQWSSQMANAISPAASWCTSNSSLTPCGAVNAVARPLVWHVSEDNGRGLIRGTTFSYQNGRYYPGEPAVQADLGFSGITRYDDQTGIKVVDWFDQELHHQGHVMERDTTSGTGARMSKQTFTYNTVYNDNVAWVQLQTTTDTSFDDGLISATRTHNYSYDAYGYLSSDYYNVSNRGVRQTDYSRTSDPSTWLMGRVDGVKVHDPSATAGDVVLDWSKTAYYADQIHPWTMYRMMCPISSECLCDSQGNSCTTTDGGPAHWAAVQNNIQYFPNGLLQSSQDALDRLTEHTWDTGFQAQEQNTTRHFRDQLGNWQLAIEQRSYDTFNRLQNDTTFDERTTTTSYDNMGRVSEVDYANGGFTKTNYVYLGDPTQQRIETTQAMDTDSNNKVRSLVRRRFFDGMGRVYLQDQTGDSGVVTQQWTRSFPKSRQQDMYQLPAVPDETPAWIVVDYDANGRPSQVTQRQAGFADITRERIAYGPATVSVTDGRGHVTVDTYDGAHALTNRLDANGGNTTYTRDELGRILRVDLPDGSNRTATYDSWGRTIKTTEPARGTTTSVFDDGSRLTQSTDANGHVRVNSYDELDRPTNLTVDGAGVISWRYESAAFSPNFGHLTDVSDRGGTVHFDYNWGGDIATAIRHVNDSEEYTESYGYDFMHRMRSLTFPDKSFVVYGFSDGNNLSSVTYGPRVLAKFGHYTGSGQARGAIIGGTTRSATYDPLGFLTKGSFTANGVDLLDESFKYDGNYNLQSVSDLRAVRKAGTMNTDSTQTLGYDVLDRLTYAQGTYGTLNYGYDPIGNLTVKDGLNINDSGSVVTGVTPPSAGSPNQIAWQIKRDAAGNTTSKTNRAGTYAYMYDSLNQLESVSLNGNLLVQFDYDYTGRRLHKKFYSSSQPFVSTYVTPHYEVQRSDARGTHKTTLVHIDAPGYGHLVTISADGLPAQNGETLAGKQTQPLSGNTTGGVLPGEWWYLANRLNSTSVVVDGNGLQIERLSYMPYGEIDGAHSVGADVAIYKVTGQEHDAETGLEYFSARYYDSETGRFLSADDRNGGGMRPQAFNRYAFMIDNPLTYADPSGHDVKNLCEILSTFLPGGVYTIGFTVSAAIPFYASPSASYQVGAFCDTRTEQWSGFVSESYPMVFQAKPADAMLSLYEKPASTLFSGGLEAEYYKSQDAFQGTSTVISGTKNVGEFNLGGNFVFSQDGNLQGGGFDLNTPGTNGISVSHSLTLTFTWQDVKGWGNYLVTGEINDAHAIPAPPGACFEPAGWAPAALYGPPSDLAGSFVGPPAEYAGPSPGFVGPPSDLAGPSPEAGGPTCDDQ